MEQTSSQRKHPKSEQKHLHIRGADSRKIRSSLFPVETPPHTWSRLQFKTPPGDVLRNTSTYVEQTEQRFNFEKTVQKHLHIRGADSNMAGLLVLCVETPPHTWSRLVSNMLKRAAKGNTSTYVEQTVRTSDVCACGWKHLHIRGADHIDNGRRNTLGETPPHTWSRLVVFSVVFVWLGNTSTYVEQTSLLRSNLCPVWKHLHIRGAD